MQNRQEFEADELKLEDEWAVHKHTIHNAFIEGMRVKADTGGNPSMEINLTKLPVGQEIPK